jgi:CHAT domain-containing protein
MKRLDEYRAGIGATDLHLHAAELGTRLALMGIRLAVDSGTPERVFAWSERLRASGSARSTPEPELEEALVGLRRAATNARRAEPEQISEARNVLLEHEQTVRDLSRQKSGARSATRIPSLSDIQAALDDRTLIEFVDDGTALVALVVTSKSARMIRLGKASKIVELVDHLRFSSERIARPSTSAASQVAAVRSAQETLASLRDTLATPIALDASRIVAVPTGALHSVPMAMLFDVPVTTAPSATSWLNAHRTAPLSGRPVVSSGPDLVHAAAEAEEIASISGADIATEVDKAIDALDGAALAHFACHARPRVDSPMFSSLILDDGELTLYDIERLHEPPSIVVLAACAGGAAVQASGDEVLSLAGSFLAMGARTVIAPLFTVSDEMTAQLMRSFHQALATGSDPATALLAARSVDDPMIALTAGSFVCFGAS